MAVFYTHESNRQAVIHKKKRQENTEISSIFSYRLQVSY